MGTLTVALFGEGDSQTEALLETLAAHSAVARILLLTPASQRQSRPDLLPEEKTRLLSADPFQATGLARVLDATETDFLLIVLPGEKVQLGQRAIDRLLSVARDSGAALLYSDFRDDAGGILTDHPLIDHQPGSIRDSFDFGSIILLSMSAVNRALDEHGQTGEHLKWSALYDLRLKLSRRGAVLRIPEPLYTRVPLDIRASGERQFDYVDPRRRDYQMEVERVATTHLKLIGAYLEPQFESLPQGEQDFAVRASVVIPVRNRERTIKEAVSSALSQHASFSFNVIVVDNHSTDRTTDIVKDLAREHDRLIHLIPSRTDLGIGGCWNEAIYSPRCGQYAVQLDSDDLYADQRTLDRIVSKFEEGPYAMVIGSYTIVNFDLQEIPPGVIDHREWTRENGRNNALRINGLGAPRAFYVPVLRETGLPDTSYGEDYAAALRISRRYEIGRIYESVYFARRWEGNSDAALPLATANRYDAYKDHIRTLEILARKRMNQK